MGQQQPDRNEPVNELIELSKRESDQAVTGARDLSYPLTLIQLIAGLAGMIVGFTLATLISWSITTLLKRVIALT